MLHIMSAETSPLDAAGAAAVALPETSPAAQSPPRGVEAAAVTAVTRTSLLLCHATCPLPPSRAAR